MNLLYKLFKIEKADPHSLNGILQKSNLYIMKRVIILIAVFVIGLIFTGVCTRSMIDYMTCSNASYSMLLETQKWVYAVEDCVVDGGDASDIDISAIWTSFEEAEPIMRKRAYGESGAKIDHLKEMLAELQERVKECLAIYADSQEEAEDYYDEEIFPYLQEMQDEYISVGGAYFGMVGKATVMVECSIGGAIILGVAIFLLMMIGAIKQCRDTYHAVAEPIDKVAEYAEVMAEGNTDFVAENDIASIDFGFREANRMLSAFLKMADNISQNIDVVKRVADGDLTAFVNINSEDDALGKNLYKMVQNNDFMFAEVADIAGGVATQIGYIAEANTNLADGCTKQAQVVTDFVDMLGNMAQIVDESTEKAKESTASAHTVKKEVSEAMIQMGELKDAMTEIDNASNKISEVIAAIENIASQTNLLSLNASIEAARAGEAGRGFSVVAESIGGLAMQSAELAKESRQLIEDTIACTNKGNNIATRTFEAFDSMNKSVDEIVGATGQISESSVHQKEYMDNLKSNVDEISDSVTQNAAFSEETASMSDEIIRGADKLKESIAKFNLRQRVDGEPYIPPEKAHDKEFIAEATRNYQKYREKLAHF